MFVVNAVAETWCVDNGKGNPDSVLLQLDVDRLDPDRRLLVGSLSSLENKIGVHRRVRVLWVGTKVIQAVNENSLVDQRVYKGGTSSAGGAWCKWSERRIWWCRLENAAVMTHRQP